MLFSWSTPWCLLQEVFRECFGDEFGIASGSRSAPTEVFSHWLRLIWLKESFASGFSETWCHAHSPTLVRVMSLVATTCCRPFFFFFSFFFSQQFCRYNILYLKLLQGVASQISAFFLKLGNLLSQFWTQTISTKIDWEEAERQSANGSLRAP